MCMKLEVEHDTFKTLVELIEEEIDLYGPEDMIILTQASFIMFNRALLAGALKFTKP